MKILRAISTLLLILLTAASFTLAQDKSKKDRSSLDLPKERSITVKVNVKVVDAAGNPINDLKQGDLRLFEDGVEQKINYFAYKEPTLKLGLVIDNSGSLRPLLERLVVSGGDLVEQLTGNDEAFLVRFVSSEKIEVIQEWTGSKFKLRNGLENMYVEGGQSAVIDALYLSAEKLRQREEQNRTSRLALVLVTDGEDRASFYKLNDLFGLFKNSDIQIFIVGLTNALPKNKENEGQAKHPRQAAEKFLQTLSLETGGTAHLLSSSINSEGLAAAAKAIGEELRYQYVIGYTSGNPKRDGLERKLRIEIADGEKGAKRQGTVRSGFVVPIE